MAVTMSETQTLTFSTTRSSHRESVMKHSQTVDRDISRNGYEFDPPWTGPSVITSIRTGKTRPFQSLLKTNNRAKTAINKQHRTGPVFLGRLGFEGDEQTYHDHGGPEKAVLQFNPNNYSSWHEELKDFMVKDDDKRKALLSPGGMGENIAAQNQVPGRPAMDEHTMCIGDVVGIRNSDRSNTDVTKICVTGPRQPCYKLNHRFGVADMSQRAQNQSRTGWLYSTLEEGSIEVGDEMILLERPYPDWPVARVQYYLYSEPRNFDMIKELLDELGDALVYDVRSVFRNRVKKGIEDMLPRLKGGNEKEAFVQYRLREKNFETARISEFVFERTQQLSNESPDFAIAEPGSHVRLKIRLLDRDQQEIVRPYSIITGNSNTFRIGVALSDTSRGGSSYLHQTLSSGDVVEASETFANTFPLMDTEIADTHIFLAGGIGITAFLDHIRCCIDIHQPFQLHYMVRNKSDIAFQSTLDALLTTHSRPPAPSASIHIYDSSSQQRCDVQAVLASVSAAPRTHIYTCGSERLSNAVTHAAKKLNISTGRLHFEQFTVDATGDPFTALLATSQRTIHIAAEQSLLEALRETGFDVPSSCEAGNCGTCRVRVKCGKVVHRGTGLEDDEKAGEGVDAAGRGEMLSCVSRGVGVIQLEL